MKYSELKRILDELNFEGTNIDPDIEVNINAFDSVNKEIPSFSGHDIPVRAIKRSLNWNKLYFIIHIYLVE